MNQGISACYCGRRQPFNTCCGLFLSHKASPATPEDLMRSRYSAFVLADMDYIANTMKGPAAEDFDAKSSRQWATSVTWVRLKVIDTEYLPEEDRGFVEFVAIYRESGGAAQKIHERSEFRRLRGRWYYWSGESLGEKS